MIESLKINVPRLRSYNRQSHDRAPTIVSFTIGTLQSGSCVPRSCSYDCQFHDRDPIIHDCGPTIVSSTIVTLMIVLLWPSVSRSWLLRLSVPRSWLIWSSVLRSCSYDRQFHDRDPMIYDGAPTIDSSIIVTPMIVSSTIVTLPKNIYRTCNHHYKHRGRILLP